MRIDLIHIRIRIPRLPAVIAHVRRCIILILQIPHISHVSDIVRPRKKSTPHIRRRPALAVIHLAPPPDRVCVIGHGGRLVAGTVVEGAGVVAYPGVLNIDPPVPLELLDFDADFFLGAAGDAVRGESRAGENGTINLDPAYDIAVVAAEVVTLLLVAVIGVISEKMRIKVATNFLVDLPADFDGLVVAEGGVEAADLEEGEVARGLDVGRVAGDHALAAVIHYSLF